MCASRLSLTFVASALFNTNLVCDSLSLSLNLLLLADRERGVLDVSWQAFLPPLTHLIQPRRRSCGRTAQQLNTDAALPKLLEGLCLWS
jgi:hypothetical protein